MNYRRVTLFLSITVGLLSTALFVILFLLFQFDILPPFASTNRSLNSENNDLVNLDLIQVDLYASDLEIPWSIVFIDEETTLVTERTGQIKIIKDGVVLDEPILDLSNEIVSIGEAGLMDMKKDPEFSQNSFIYIYHTYNSSNSEVLLRVDKYLYQNETLSKVDSLIEDIPSGRVHSGGELGFGPDGKLYITTGDVAQKELAQDLSSLAGKTLRINKDGSIPDDNPFLNNPEARGEIWSLGHRNAQGMDWHPETKEMYQSEHGPSGFDGGTGQDEINLIRRGQNYGWPIIRGEETSNNMFTPIIQYTPAIAPGSILFIEGTNTDWDNILLVAALRGEGIIVLKIKGDEVTQIGSIANNEYGRIRELKQGPDNNVYFTTSNRDGRGEVREGDDKIYRINLN